MEIARIGKIFINSTRKILSFVDIYNYNKAIHPEFDDARRFICSVFIKTPGCVVRSFTAGSTVNSEKLIGLEEGSSKMRSFSTLRLDVKLPFLILFFLTALPVFGAGEIDQSFNGALINLPPENVSIALVQPDDKILVYGNFESVGGKATNTLVRLNADGTLDTTFNAPKMEPTITGFGYGVQSLALQSDGKIIVGGHFTNVVDVNANVEAHVLVRLNPDGSRDTSFAFPSATTPFRRVARVEVLPDDSILFSADVTTNNDGTFTIRKLNPDGSVDNSFTPCFGIQFRRLPDGKIIWKNGGTIKRLNADCTADNTFQQISVGGSIYSFDVQADGKIVFGGDFSTVNGFAMPKIGRANANGTIDAAFVSTITPSGNVNNVLVLPDGKILFAGNIAGSPNGGINRLNADGTLDASFNQVAAGQGNIQNLSIQSDGKIIRTSQRSNSAPTQLVARLNTNGSTDSAFQPGFGMHATGRTVFVQPDGKILVSGVFAYARNSARQNLARFNTDGSLDTGFNPDFTLSGAFSYASSFDAQPDGRIIIGLTSTTLDARRLNADGTTEIVFANTKSANKVKVLSDGKILIAGSRYLRRFNSDGSLDSGFNVSFPATGTQSVNAFVVQPDGKIVIGGTFSEVNSTARINIARLNPDGSLDPSYTAAVNSTISEMALQTDGKLVIGGYFSAINFTTGYKYLARLNADGSLDTGYQPTLPSEVYSLRLQPDNKALVGGNFTTFMVGQISRQDVTRFYVDGTPDTTFNIPDNIHVPDGYNSWVYSIDLQADGKVVVAGEFSRANRLPVLGIARLLNAPAKRTPFDYDGDGRSDISVFRPAENKWYILQSSNLSLVQINFGAAGDIPTPADFDGDGKTDPAVFRPSAGDWWYRSSIAGNQVNVHWGQAGDIPRPSDFDGDGRTDFIVYRPSNSGWYGFGTTGQTSITQFGIAEDKPLVGDFDGDGKSDLAVFRPSTGDWWFAGSSSGQFAAVHWGQLGDIPVPGDYDADGKTDFVVYRPSNGGWYILRSGEQNYTILSFGLAEDKPVAGDYDGDGKADVAVWRPSTGVWYLLQTTSGFGAVQFGLSGDVPTENAFLP